MKLKSIFILWSLLLILFCSCTNKNVIDYKYLASTEWIYNSDSIPDSIRNFTDNYLLFRDSNVIFNGDEIGKYQISSDTIRIVNTAYFNSAEFTGLITKLDNNELWIRKLSGFFPLKYNDQRGNFDNSAIIKFVNQENKKRDQIHFEYISIAASTCYGSCPEFNFELYHSGKFKFKCTSNCKKIGPGSGSYTGSFSKQEMDSIIGLVSYLNLKNDSTVFDTPIDADETTLMVKVNKKVSYFKGNSCDFQLKMIELLNFIYKKIENSKMVKTDSKLSFKVRSYELPIEKTIPFLPPVAN